MARPTKCRKVCAMPTASGFVPDSDKTYDKIVTLTVEEYETIRLIDLEGMSQEECADSMQISRTTAQQIYWDARKKLAQMLVDELPLRISGGNYRICEQAGIGCGRCCCRRNREEQEEKA